MKEVLANRVYLSLPEIKEYTVTVPEETKKQLQDDLLSKMDRLTVFAKGEGIGEGKVLLDRLSIGNEVFADPGKIRLCPIFEIEGKRKISVNIYDIMHIW